MPCGQAGRLQARGPVCNRFSATFAFSSGGMRKLLLRKANIQIRAIILTAWRVARMGMPPTAVLKVMALHRLCISRLEFVGQC